MISLVVFLISFTCIFLIFRKRYRLTRHDLSLQNELHRESKQIHNNYRESFRRKITRIASSPIKTIMSLGKSKNINVMSLLKEADVMISKGLAENATKILLQIITFDNKFTEAFKKLGLIYLHNGDNVKAEYILKRLIKIRKDPVSYSNLALAIFNQGKLRESAKYYELALKLDRSRANRYVNLGRVYHELKLFDKALECFEKALKLEPKNTEYLFIIADYYQKKHNTAKFTLCIQKILAIDPYNDEAKRKLAS